jgi:hypothetical protein
VGALQLVIGLAALTLGLVMVAGRERIVARHRRRRGRAEVPAMGWLVLGVTWTLVGVLNLALALA